MLVGIANQCCFWEEALPGPLDLKLPPSQTEQQSNLNSLGNQKEMFDLEYLKDSYNLLIRCIMSLLENKQNICISISPEKMSKGSKDVSENIISHHGNANQKSNEMLLPIH